MIFVYFQGKPFNITAIHAYASATNVEELKLIDSAGPTRPSRINTKKKKKKEEEEKAFSS